MELPWRLFGGIIVLWLLVGVVPFLFLRDLHDAAEFASAFGFVNALFAALAFGGVIWAIRLQTKERMALCLIWSCSAIRFLTTRCMCPEIRR
jgi:hypothetical protein